MLDLLNSNIYLPYFLIYCQLIEGIYFDWKNAWLNILIKQPTVDKDYDPL